MTSTLVLDDDLHSQDVPYDSASIVSEDDLESFTSECISLDHDEGGSESEASYSEEFEDESNDEGRISPEVDHNDINFDLFSENEPCLLVVQHPEVIEPSIPIKSYTGYPLITRHRGYRLCGDNIDKSIHRRHLRFDKQNLSLHYFHTYAVENRIDFSDLSDESKEGLYGNLSDKHSMAVSLLPTTQDDLIMGDNISKMVPRVLVTHLKFFKLSFDDLIEWHITHKYYSEMSTRSCVVSFNYLRVLVILIIIVF